MPVQIRWPVPKDLEIAQEAQLRPIQDVARDAGLVEDELELHGRHVAKIDYVNVLERLREAGAPLPCVALAFGPGLVVEAMLVV